MIHFLYTNAKHQRKPIETAANQNEKFFCRNSTRFYVDNIWKKRFTIIFFIMNLANLQSKIPPTFAAYIQYLKYTKKKHYAKWTRE